MKKQVNVFDYAGTICESMKKGILLTAKDGDWELKSLKAFDTNETLTLTMVGGEVYTIKVTDAAVKITINGVDYDDDNNDTCSWWITTSTDGKAYTQNTTKDADGWDPDRIIHVSGSGTFNIALQRKAGYTGDTLYVDIHQIRIEEGAKLLRECTAALDAAEQKVTILTAGEQGEPVERPFDEEV